MIRKSCKGRCSLAAIFILVKTVIPSVGGKTASLGEMFRAPGSRVKVPDGFVILAEEFADIFDGFSIGSNDLTQLILGVDRDSEIVSDIFDERNPAVKKMIAEVISVCRKKGRKIGICGQAPSDYPDFAQFLVEQKIDSISLNPDTVMKTTLAILEKETAQK